MQTLLLAFSKDMATARFHTGLSQAEAAKALTEAGVKVAERTIASWESGQNTPSEVKQRAVLQALQEIAEKPSEPDGVVVRPPQATGPASTPASALAKRLRETTTLHLHTAVAAAPSASSGALVFDESSRVTVTLPRVICRQWLGFDPPEVMGVSEVTGDSMEPLLYDGDLVLYSLTPEVNGGGLFVVNYDSRMLCKRVQQVGKTFRLIPENRLAGYIAETIRSTDAGFVHDETEDEIDFGIVGKILWPNQHASRLHIQQVGELLRRMFREAADDQHP